MIFNFSEVAIVCYFVEIDKKTFFSVKKLIYKSRGIRVCVSLLKVNFEILFEKNRTSQFYFNIYFQQIFIPY